MGGLHAGWALFLCRPASAPASPVQTDASAGNTDAACAFCTTPFVCTSFRKLMSAYHYQSILATRSAASVHARVHRLPLSLCFKSLNTNSLTFTVIDTISNSATVPPLLRRGQNRCGPHKKTRKNFPGFRGGAIYFAALEFEYFTRVSTACISLQSRRRAHTYLARFPWGHVRTYIHMYVYSKRRTHDAKIILNMRISGLHAND